MRAAKRRLAKASDRTSSHQNALRQVLSHGTAVETDRSAETFDASRGAHTGKPGTKKQLGTVEERRGFYQLADLLAQGFEYVKWDGRTPTPVIDRLGRIVAVLAGQPEDPTYSNELMQAYNLMEARGNAYGIGSSASQPHKRGHFSAYNCGTTMGMGNRFPVFMNPKAKRPLIQELLDAKPFQRMASYQSRTFILLWAPRVYAEYEHVNGVLRQKMRIRPNFAGSIFLVQRSILARTSGRTSTETSSTGLLVGVLSQPWVGLTRDIARSSFCGS
ncbi:hypothetical protein BDP27DRAFT_1234242 [Rhodocollybia butyracea]|uniref:Uncharacterized protein n=1 Tax=Rhodocollybia butyracea TaxID=206335 RepID=A0A9P5PEQ0_9AGAR|nr:hypothetical protein BDP27DRAFT_1234242 [Rhodocollybia butyracea]